MLTAAPSSSEAQMRRKNPLAGAASFGELVVREVRLGADDDAIHQVRGQMVLDGDVDTVVLRVQENAEVERILLVGRLEVGRNDGNPYGSGSYPTGGYPSDGSAPDRGASIDEEGTLRPDGWVVIGDIEHGLVLRSPEGRYFGFTVDDDGRLVSLGRFLGWVEPVKGSVGGARCEVR